MLDVHPSATLVARIEVETRELGAYRAVAGPTVVQSPIPSLLISAMAERCMSKIVDSIAHGKDDWENDDNN